MTTIKDFIEMGAYPKDDKGRALVPVGCGKVATICATDAPGEKPILGFIRSDDKLYQASWNAWDEHGNNCPSQPRACWVDLLPPPPRKVTVKRYVQVNAKGDFSTVESHPSDLPFRHSDGWQMVELTGEYEQPWSQP